MMIYSHNRRCASRNVVPSLGGSGEGENTELSGNRDAAFSTGWESGVFADQEGTGELQGGQAQADTEKVQAGDEGFLINGTLNPRDRIGDKSGDGVDGVAGVMAADEPKAGDE